MEQQQQPEQQPEQQQPEQQQRPIRIERVEYKYGSYDLKIIGEPSRLFDVPIKYYTTPVFSKNQLGSRSQQPQADTPD